MKNNMSQIGFTLIELMVGISIGIIVVAGLTSFFIATLTGSNNLISSSKLNQEMNAAMNLMVTEIRRSGYWANAVTGDPMANPFYSTTHNISVNTISTAGDCILLSYDLDEDGVVDTTEVLGFKHVGGNEIQMRTAVNAVGTNACGTGSDSWSSISNTSAISITSLAFTTTGSKCHNFDSADNTTITADVERTLASDTSSACSDASMTLAGNAEAGDRLVETRQINITMTGELADDANINATLTSQIKVANDWVIAL
ncbi:MAG: prepilin-type N-terminal cleavage/methylation domain-containing protein [gamma proteobacterium symbiont of Taylorina sp.]|nr:prepilin-type N-terminal cleavage/methylation domain-containing protein [gamma proteobacterium symbiont of Taylorina sp.]